MQLVKQEDGTYDLVGVSQLELDLIVTMVGGYKIYDDGADKAGWAIYGPLRKHGEYRGEWLKE